MSRSGRGLKPLVIASSITLGALFVWTQTGSRVTNTLLPSSKMRPLTGRMPMWTPTQPAETPADSSQLAAHASPSTIPASRPEMLMSGSKYGIIGVWSADQAQLDGIRDAYWKIVESKWSTTRAATQPAR